MTARAAADGPRLLVVLAGLQLVLFPIPVITLFWTDQIGMSLTDVMVLQALFGASVVVFEFPSGYMADRVGYRRSLLLGTALGMVGWLLYTQGVTFGAIVLAEIVLGAGHAFMSGADRALLWSSLEVAGRQDEYRRWDGRARAAGQAGEALSAAVGGWLYAWWPRLPFWLQVPTAGFAFATAAAISEPARARAPLRGSHLENAWRIIRFTLWHHRRLRATLALTVALGLSSFVMVWLIQPYMQSRGIPPGWFGPLWAGAHLWLVVVSLGSARVAATLGARATLVGCALLVPLGYAGLAWSASAWGVVFYLCFMTLRGLQGPILASVMQADAPDEDRASVLSLAALLFRMAFVVVGPPIGALVDHLGLGLALVVLAVGFTVLVVAALAAFIRAHEGHRGRF